MAAAVFGLRAWGVGARQAAGREMDEQGGQAACDTGDAVVQGDGKGAEGGEAGEDEAAEVGQNLGELCRECRSVGADLVGDGWGAHL